MKVRMLVFLFVLIWVSPCSAQSFDCLNLPFGQDISQYDGFVKYKEKDGVEYYNYTGACRLPTHEKCPVALIYATIDGKLFAEISILFDLDEEDGLKMANELFGEMIKEYKEGGWIVSVWKDRKNNATFKAKYNKKTKITKYGYYYDPLRKLLKANIEVMDQAVKK